MNRIVGVVRNCVLAAVLGGVAFLSVELFPRVAVYPLTFIDRAMDPEASSAKYQSAWSDTTIVQMEDPELDYESGDTIGTITIPKMNLYELPIIYESNYINSNWQISAPGHLAGWGLPGEEKPTCIGSHNYQLFHNLPLLQVGDKFLIENEYDVYVYIVTDISIYNHLQSDWNDFAFRSKKPYAVELMTCYPISQVTTQDMYIVTAQMVKGTQFIPATEEENSQP